MSAADISGLYRRNAGWSVKKTPLHSTTVATHVSGREVRLRNWLYPLYAFELTFSGLASNGNFPGLGGASLQELMSLFSAAGGQSGNFLFTDPTDARANGAVLGTGDGKTTSFLFQRALFGSFSEPVNYVSNVSAVRVGGVPKLATWYLANPTQSAPYATLNFYNAPAAGQQIVADFNYAFICRFDDDSLEFEQMMAGLWQAQSVKFRSVRGGWV